MTTCSVLVMMLCCKTPTGKSPCLVFTILQIFTLNAFRRIRAIKLKEIITVDGQTVLRGWPYNETGRKSKTGKPVTELHQLPTPWIPAEALLRHALVHHNCGGSGCGAARECPVHHNCDESCPYSRITVFHKPDSLYIVDKAFRDLAS